MDELRFLRRQTRKPVKVTVVGPVTALHRLADEHYGDEERAALALAAALNRELRVLDAAGAGLLQIDEPAFHARLSLAKRFGVAAINRMVEGVRAPVAVHVCYGYAYGAESKEANPAYTEVLALLASCDIQAISLEYEQPGHAPDLLAHCGDRHVIPTGRERGGDAEPVRWGGSRTARLAVARCQCFGAGAAGAGRFTNRPYDATFTPVWYNLGTPQSRDGED